MSELPIPVPCKDAQNLHDLAVLMLVVSDDPTITSFGGRLTGAEDVRKSLVETAERLKKIAAVKIVDCMRVIPKPTM